MHRSLQQDELFPIFLDLRERPVLIVGGGASALEKLEKIWPCGARISVIARRLSETMQERLEALSLPWVEREFQETDLAGQFLLISAVDDAATHARLAAAARAQRVLVNTVDAPASSDFYCASQLRRGPLQVALSTRGLFPGVARALRLWLEQALPAELAEELDELSFLRQLAKSRIPDPARRMRALREQLSLWLEDLSRTETTAPALAAAPSLYRRPAEALSPSTGAAL